MRTTTVQAAGLFWRWRLAGTHPAQRLLKAIWSWM